MQDCLPTPHEKANAKLCTFDDAPTPRTPAPRARATSGQGLLVEDVPRVPQLPDSPSSQELMQQGNAFLLDSAVTVFV